MNGFSTKDPYLLLSLMNTKLRDEGEKFEDLCLTYALDQEELIKRMESVGYTYNNQVNQFTK